MGVKHDTGNDVAARYTAAGSWCAGEGSPRYSGNVGELDPEGKVPYLYRVC